MRLSYLLRSQIISIAANEQPCGLYLPKAKLDNGPQRFAGISLASSPMGQVIADFSLPVALRH